MVGNCSESEGILGMKDGTAPKGRPAVSGSPGSSALWAARDIENQHTPVDFLSNAGDVM